MEQGPAIVWRVCWRFILARVDGEFRPFKSGELTVCASTKAEVSWSFECAVEGLFGEKARVFGLGITQYEHDAASAVAGDPPKDLTATIKYALAAYYELVTVQC